MTGIAIANESCIAKHEIQCGASHSSFSSIMQTRRQHWLVVWRMLAAIHRCAKVHRSAGRAKGKVGRADWAVAHIQKLYRVEVQISDRTPEEKYALRQLHALPLLMEFKVWLDKTAQQTTPKTTLGEAVAYTLRQWGKLITYTQHGHFASTITARSAP